MFQTSDLIDALSLSCGTEGGYRSVQFRIQLKPVPASRPRVTKYNRTYYPKAYTEWRAEAPRHIGEIFPLLYGPVGVVVEVVCPKFKTVERLVPPGDIDNYLKATLDAITTNESVWHDDRQVKVLVSGKRFVREGEEPHTFVYVREVV